MKKKHIIFVFLGVYFLYKAYSLYSIKYVDGDGIGVTLFSFELIDQLATENIKAMANLFFTLGGVVMIIPFVEKILINK